MKIFALTMTMLLAFSLHAETATTTEKKEEDTSKVKATALKVSGETKRALRKVGRKSMDETCELNESKAACEKQKAEHKALNAKEAVEGVPGN